MNTFESNEYVIQKAKLISPFFKNRGWFITAGKNNCILINIPADDDYNYTKHELANMVAEAEDQSPKTGMVRTMVTYMFFHHLVLLTSVTVLPGSRIDGEDVDS